MNMFKAPFIQVAYLTFLFFSTSFFKELLYNDHLVIFMSVIIMAIITTVTNTYVAYLVFNHRSLKEWELKREISSSWFSPLTYFKNRVVIDTIHGFLWLIITSLVIISHLSVILEK